MIKFIDNIKANFVSGKIVKTLKTKHKIIIAAISSIVLILVILSVVLKDFKVENPKRFLILPKLNAFLNGLSFISLLFSYYFIKKKNVKRHVGFIMLSLLLTVLFLVSYLTYHFTVPPTHFDETGIIKTFYLLVLLTHVLLAAMIIPLILITLTYAFEKQNDLHKKWAKRTLPLWLYVSLTGVLIYLLNSAYYLS